MTPDLKVESATDDRTFSLKEAKGKYVALHFLLKTECPICQRFTRAYITQAGTLPDVEQVFLKPDTREEIAAWAAAIPAEELKKFPVYRDPEAKWAKAFNVPDGYQFHGQVVHYPATILIGPDGKEVYRYEGKSNKDRLEFDALAAKVAELKKMK
jgi:peroxiredoxin Q/BCP